MLPTSHLIPIDAPPPAPHGLAEAFSDFISASARLEISYRDLQAEVRHLGHELSERNLALNASLAKNEAMSQSLKGILDSLPCGVLVLNREGDIRFTNPEAALLLDLPRAHMTSLCEIHERRGIDLSCIPSDSTATSSEQEIAVPGPAGGRWLAARRQSLHPAATSADSAAEDILILRDVSGRRRWEAEREAARSAVALAEVSSILAHEIRNPLASLELFTSLLEDCPDRLPEWISHLRAGIRSLSGTVNNVLALNGGTALVLERLDMDRELHLAVDFVRPLALQAGISLILLTSAEAMPFYGNRSALQQLLLNLCSNAIRHTCTGGRIRIHPQLQAGRLLVSVEDNGQGIAPDVQRHLFHSRFSGSGSTSGLGLAVCSRLMQQHGGSIRVHSELHHGATFIVEFPAL